MSDEEERHKAAEKVCWTLLIMMGLGHLELPLEDRQWLAKDFQKWVDLAVRDGVMDSGKWDEIEFSKDRDETFERRYSVSDAEVRRLTKDDPIQDGS